MGLQYKRLQQDAAAVLFIDHQSGLFSLVREPSTEQLRNGILALADLAKFFALPTVLTTSCDDAANGPLIHELNYTFPAAPLVRRDAALNAWDDREVVDAVHAAGRKQLIVSGVLTEACVTSTVLSAVQEGFEVFVVADACGSLSRTTRHNAWRRMADAGAQIVDWYSVACELQRQVRSGGQSVADILVRHMSGYSDMVQSFERLKVRRVRHPRPAAALRHTDNSLP
ncbi:isochorismatase family protein [Schauerella aestuarii]|uniref:isochorismatase family protein n=1 Tax=Schauerella aestuarii TaxID=2511204 RepID=UPI001371D0E1|nr:isochorismatase family protein [Achromobacter aestuarii]MYZ45634.1 isochorismatase family protein [Achromobacter aestuarii]